MKLREIKVGDLLEFIKSDIYKNSANLAITQQRAISQFHNPRASKDDVALIIAINKEDEIVGFIGSLPDKINQLPKVKFSWNTCWWVDQKKGKGTAIPLLLNFLKVWKNNVAFRDMTPKTKKIIARFNNFQTVKKLNGYRFFVRFNLLSVFLSRNKLFVLISPLLFIFDTIANLLISLKPIKSKHYNAVRINKIDDESAKFINNFNTNELFKRDQKELNWIIDKPWVLKKSSHKNQFYYFSDTSKAFNNYIYKIFNTSSELIAVLFINNNNGLVKIPYIYFNKKDTAIIVQFIFNFLRIQKAISFLTYNNIIINEINNSNHFYWHKKANNKEFVISKTLASQINLDFVFQDGEGDFVFT